MLEITMLELIACLLLIALVLAFRVSFFGKVQARAEVDDEPRAMATFSEVTHAIDVLVRARGTLGPKVDKAIDALLENLSCRAQFAMYIRTDRSPDSVTVSMTTAGDGDSCSAHRSRAGSVAAQRPALLRIEGGDALQTMLRTLCARAEVEPVIPVGVEVVPFPAETVTTEGDVGRLVYDDGYTCWIRRGNQDRLSLCLRAELERRGSVPLSGTPGPYR